MADRDNDKALPQEGTGTATRPVPTLLRVLFLLSAVATLSAVAATVWDELRPEWTDYYLEVQKRLSQSGVAGTEGFPPVMVPQILVPELGAVDRCTACHAGVERAELAQAEAPLASHPGPMLEVHEAARVGCTSCHDGQGRATRLPDAHGEVAHWDMPMLRGELVQASCARCHRRDRVPRAPQLRLGAELMKRHACFGCHVMAGAGERGKVGPDLTFAASRNSREWLYAWLKSPRSMLANPRMADFSLSDSDAADIVSFLLSLQEVGSLPDHEVPPADASEDQLDALYERGSTVYRISRCVSCHAVDGKGGTVGPEHGSIGSKMSSTAIAAWLEDPDRYHSGRRMPRFRLTLEDRDAVAYFLSEEMKRSETGEALEKAALTLERLLESASPDKGRRRMHALGCLGCHRVEGQVAPQPVGPDLTRFGEKQADRLPFAADWRAQRTREAWTREKLRSPRAGSENLLMPSMPLSEQELYALLVATLGLTTPAPPELRADADIDEPALHYPRGAAGNLVRDLRCLTCHTVDGTGASYAPDLSQEGSRVRVDWLRDFLREPYEIRPILVMRMPRFFLADGEIETLSLWLTMFQVREEAPGAPKPPAGSAAIGERLYAELRCAGCHILKTQGGAIGPNLSDVGRRLLPSWIAWQLQDPAAAKAEEPRVVETEEQATHLAAFLATRILEATSAGSGPAGSSAGAESPSASGEETP